MKKIRVIAAMLFLFLRGTTLVHAQTAGIEWEVLNQETVELYRQGNYDRAVALAQKALEVAEKNTAPDHPDVATSLNNLAALYRSQGDYAKAEPLHKRALAIRESSLGPDHPDVAISLNNLAELYRSQGDYAKAEPLYKRALAIWEKSLGPDHPDVATGLNNLAELYRSQGDYAKAEPLHKRALAIRERSLGPDHPDVATSLNNLAELYRSQGDYAKAEPLHKRALAIWEKSLGPDHPDVATGLNNLAELYRSQGDYAKAEPLYKRALAIWEKSLGPDHPHVATGRKNLATLYLATNRDAEASEFLNRAEHIPASSRSGDLYSPAEDKQTFAGTAPMTPPLSYDDLSPSGLPLAFFLTWGVGLTPPLIIRYAIARRPLSKKAASSIAGGWCLLLYIVEQAFLHADGEPAGKVTLVYIIMFGVSQWIMARNYEPVDSSHPREAKIGDGDGASVWQLKARQGSVS